LLTQDDAEAIAGKLGCTPYEGRSHKYYRLFVDQKLVARFGVRRASREKGHGHLPRDLHINQKQCSDLSTCPLSKDDYLQILRERNIL
jgi:hypothetical protein